MTRTILKISAFILALGSLVFLTACDNLMDTPKSRKGEGTITFSVAGSKERTVAPTINIAKYQLFGGKTGDTEELITEFTRNEVSARLETGEWNFTLKALDALGTIILQDTKAATLTAGGSLRITFNLKPLSDGVGSVSVRVNFPFTRINQVDVSFVGETNTYSIFGGPFIFNKNDVVPGDHLLTLVFRNGSEQLKTIREIVKVGASLKSEKVFNFTEADLGNAFFTDVAQGDTLYEKLDWIDFFSNDQSNYLVELTENDISTGYTLSYYDDYYGYLKHIAITLRGSGNDTTINIASSGKIFTIGKNVTLTLENIILKGVENSNSLIIVEDGGTLILNEGAKIIENEYIYADGTASGGGVNVNSGGLFIMNRGEISGNSANYVGGGVYVAGGGSFIMNGGIISGNSALGGGGGGVYVSLGGEFIKKSNGFIYGKSESGSNSSNLENTAMLDASGHAAYYDRNLGFFQDRDITDMISSNTTTNWETLSLQPLEFDEWTPGTTTSRQGFSFTAPSDGDIYIHVNYLDYMALIVEILDSNYNYFDSQYFEYSGDWNVFLEPEKVYYVMVRPEIEDTRDYEIAINGSQTPPD